MNDALMSRDHQWNTSGFPAAASLSNYYPVRQGSLCYANDAELEEGLAREAAAQNSPITIIYIGSDTDHSAMDAFEQWFNNNYWKYGMTGYSTAYTDYSCVIRITYDGSSNESGNHLDTPVPAPDFDLDSPDGHYILNRYQDNGVVLIFGREGCYNTEGLLEGLSPQLSSLNSSGVDVLVCADGAVGTQDLSALQEQYPGFHFTYDSAGLLSGYLQAVGYTSQTVTYLCIFIINKDQKITYYSTGYVSDIDEVAAEAYAVATGSPLPQPEKNDPAWNGKGNVNDIEQGESIAASVQSLSAEHHVILLMGEGVYEEEAQLLSGYEAEYSLLSKLNVSLVASFMEISDEEKAAYPHCTFVDYSNADFLSLLYMAGYEGSSADYCTSMFIQKGGAIQAYTNGSVLSANDCARYAARQVRYAAAVPDALTEIGKEAFADTAFESIDLTGGNLQRILSGAFADCTDLIVVRIPESVSEIEEDAFLNCGDLIVVCTVDSAAYRYAQAHGFDCVCE